MNKVFALVALAALVAEFVAPSRPACAQGPAPTIVTYDKLLEYLKLDVKEEKILRMVAESPSLFTLSQEQEAELRKAGGSDGLITAIRTKTTTAAASFKPGDIGAFVVILDCSGSMKDKDASGSSKWDAAQTAAIDFVQAIPDGRELAFIVYGHDASRACKAVDTIAPLGPVDKVSRARVVSMIQRLQPVGHTPIAASLASAARELSFSKVLSRVILITDGMETCHGDPEKAAAALSENKLFTGLDVVGLGLNNEESDKVAAIAKKGKGKYYDAKTAKELEKAFVDIGKVVIDRPNPIKLQTGNKVEMVRPNPIEFQIGKKVEMVRPSQDQFQTRFVDTKPTFDKTAPAPLELFKVVGGRLDNSSRTKKAHYWQIDVPAGTYKFVLEANPVGFEYKRVAIGVFLLKDDGETDKKICDVNTTDNISRYVGVVEFAEATKATLMVGNGVEMGDYNLGVFPVDAPLGMPFHKYPQTVKKGEVGKPIETVVDGMHFKTRDDYYAISLPAGDYTVSLEFTKKGGNSIYVPSVSTVTKDGHLVKELLHSITSAPTTSAAKKLFLAEDQDVIFRLRCGGAKGPIKFKVEKANN